MRISGGEFGLVERIRQWIDAAGTGSAGSAAHAGNAGSAAHAGGADVVMGIGDDAAIILPPPGKLLAACDMLVEKVHFEREYISPWQLGWKALAVNISDIAAMGGIPVFALVSMGLADWVDDAYVEGIYEGMLDIARRFNVKPVGGDTVSSPKAMVLSAAILGSASFPITRSGALPGHLIAVTGCLGRSAAGLACLRRRDAQAGPSQVAAKDGALMSDLESGAAWIDELVKAHLEPLPRVREGCALAASSVVSAMMDISDGLAGDIRHIARESKVGVIIREDAVPIGESTLLAAKLLECDPLRWALSGGEDFELVFTFPPEFTDTIRDALSNAGGSMHIVGHITPETEGVVLLGRDGVKRSLAVKGYEHFGGTFSP